MTSHLVFELLSGIRSVDALLRGRAADEVTDVHCGMSAEEIAELVTALVLARIAETELAASEAQLNALSELSAWHALDARLLAPLKALRDGRSLGGQEEYLEGLIDE